MAVWAQRAFLGNPYVTVTDITMGTIASSRTSCVGVPAFFHLSASAVTATGSTYPYEDGEFTWRVTSGAEPGIHTVPRPWMIPVVNGITKSSTRDYHAEQIGPEAVFRFFEPGTKTVELTARFADGAGGYITASTTINLTVTAIAATGHLWYDSASGSDAHDGKDAWGFAVSGGAFTTATKRLVKTGAFTAYDHTAATSGDDSLANYNFIGITGGTGVTAGLYEIASKISNDEIELVYDIGGTDPSDVTSSSGPKQTVSSTVINSTTGRVLHLKGGGTYAPPGTRSAVDTRILAYGTGKAALSAQIYYNNGADGQQGSNHVWHRLSRTDTFTNACLAASTGSSTESSVLHMYLSECDLVNGQQSLVTMTMKTEATVGVGFWKCLFSNNGGSDTRGGIFVDRAPWTFVSGCVFDNLGHDSARDHCAYIDRVNHLLVDSNRFGGHGGLNYCLNTASADSPGTFSDYTNVKENLMTGTLRAWDASNGDNNPANGHFRYFVAERNVLTNLTADGVILFYNAETMTVRDNIAYALGGGTYARFFVCSVSGGMDYLAIYANQIYFENTGTTEYIFNIATTHAYSIFAGNTVWDLRGTNVESSALDFGADVLQDNILYTPNNAGTVVHDNVSTNDRTFAQFVSEADATASASSPGWPTPASGLFATANTYLTLTAAGSVYKIKIG